MPRKQRTPKIKPNNNNSDEEQQQEEEEPKKEYILKKEYKQHQAIKINEATTNFLKSNIINFNSF